MQGVGSSAGQGRLAMVIGCFDDKPLEHCAQKRNPSAQNQYGNFGGGGERQLQLLGVGYHSARTVSPGLHQAALARMAKSTQCSQL